MVPSRVGAGAVCASAPVPETWLSSVSPMPLLDDVGERLHHTKAPPPPSAATPAGVTVAPAPRTGHRLCVAAM